ncbi:MAG: serine acetyltransferase [Rhodothermia bacterium]|nr:serine acetyltransferase [Rhodothermia bacterium]
MQVTVDTGKAGYPVSADKERPRESVELPSLRQLIKEDFAACGSDWTKPGFRALANYRLGHWAMARRKRYRILLMLLYRPVSRYVRNHYGIEISPKAHIGRRCKIAHQHGITIHPLATIGDDCLIEHMVTIGAAKEGRQRPTIGDRVNVGVGAVVIGSIRVGNDVRIGPNSVIMMNVPDGATVFGNPARILPSQAKK